MQSSIHQRITVSANGAPAVRYPVGRSFFQGRFLLALGVTGLLMGGLWTHAAGTLGRFQLLFFAVLAIVLSLAVHAWRQTDTGLLAWGGESWIWTTGQQSTGGSMTVHLDLQSLMVLTLRDDQGQSVWLWVERASDPLGWGALRRAVYADKLTQAVVDGVKKDANNEMSR